MLFRSGELGFDEQRSRRGLAPDYLTHPLVRLFETVERCGLPLIARVNGHCMAPGLNLLAMCDLAVAADTALIAAPEMTPPSVDLTDDLGVRHELWIVDEPERAAAIDAAFTALDHLYVADGHHRSAAAVRIAANRSKMVSTRSSSGGQRSKGMAAPVMTAGRLGAGVFGRLRAGGFIPLRRRARGRDQVPAPPSLPAPRVRPPSRPRGQIGRAHV
mgnify:CR=1 FL=1